MRQIPLRLLLVVALAATALPTLSVAAPPVDAPRAGAQEPGVAPESGPDEPDLWDDVVESLRLIVYLIAA